MTANPYTQQQQILDLELSAQADPIEYHFAREAPSRREVIQLLGAGILISALANTTPAAAPGGAGRANRGGGGGGGGIAGTAPANLFARLHIAKDGLITLLCGKVEGGQGVRAEATLAAAEELAVSPDKITVILADTQLVPNDGPTVGSQSTPRTIPPIRQAAAATKQLLLDLAATALAVPAAELTVANGTITHTSGKSKTYADLASAQNLDQLLTQTPTPRNVTVSAVASWKVLGKDFRRPNARDIVTGKHQYPSDVQRAGMLYGKVLRAPAYNNTATTVDLSKAKALKDVVAVQDGTFVGVAAPTMAQAEKALDAIEARWSSTPHPASSQLADYFRKNAQIPANRFAAQMTAAAKSLKASYFLPFVQHTPMEPRAAVAEWSGTGANATLTVWTASQQPFGVRTSLAQAFNIPEANVRVIINDFGGGFGGKHTGECAVECARLAKAAGKPVSLRYTRAEEFTWAYFRPAGLIECEASLDAAGRITSWHFINIHSGPAAVQTPYNIPNNTCQNIDIPQNLRPLRVGSYRGLAATANAWARECFMEELATLAGQDSLAFRLAHLQDQRLRAVLETAAKRFDWPTRIAQKNPNTAVGLACATEKGGYTAACAQVTIDRAAGTFKIDHLTHVFECGKILNPLGLMQQCQGAIIQGLGPALREGMIFEDGRMQNASFIDYKVPRFADVPSMDVFQLDRPDLDPAGAGETPLISVAPALANAVSRACGKPIRELPIKLPA